MKIGISRNSRFHLKAGQRFRLKMLAWTSGFAILVLAVVFLLNMGRSEKAQGAVETLSAGSYIINMGITPQTIANGLKPYGCIYDLINNYQVPVKWIIEPTKSKDGIDFTYNSVSYRGGPFIIQKECITPAVAARLAYWQTQGMQGIYTTSPISVPVYMTVNSFPRIMIDNLAGLQSIIINYYTNAGIPASAYELGNPAGLNQCHDIWTNPHGDPTWASHYYLYNFVTVQKSFIWAECHSVSMMEGCRNPSPPNQQLNFLTSNGLQCWQSGSCGTIPESHILSAPAPYNYFHSSEPVMQFMGNMELCTQLGSERWYVPLTTGGWNATAIRGVTTGSNASPQEGVLLAYGRAYGNPANGMVMYEAGHDLTGGGGGAAQPHKVAAQRAYFNFLLLAGKERSLNIIASFPPSVTQGRAYPVSASTTSGTAPFTYEWSSTLGGGFANPVDSVTSYTAPAVTQDTTDVIRIKVTDLCGKITFQYKLVPLTVLSPLPVQLLHFKGEVEKENVRLNWATATEINNMHFTLYRSADGQVYHELTRIPGHGTTSYTQHYEYLDETAPAGLNYYRLTQTDYDGTVKAFDPIAVMKSGKSVLSAVASPNPTVDHFRFVIQSDQDQMLKIILRNINGAILESVNVQAQKGMNRYENIFSRELQPGIYTADITAGNGNRIALKLVKK